MGKAHLILLCGMMVLPGRDCLGAEAPTLNAEQVKQVVLFAPKPYFPKRARKEYKTGAGISSKHQSRNGSRSISKNREDNRALEF